MLPRKGMFIAWLPPPIFKGVILGLFLPRFELFRSAKPDIFAMLSRKKEKLNYFGDLN